MTIRLRRRTLIRIVSLITALVTVLAVAFILKYYESTVYKRFVRNNSERSLSELADYMNNVDTSLQKGKYATSPVQILGFAAEVSRQTAAAKSTLDQLPIEQKQLSRASSLLAQAGDYALYIAKQVINGGTPSKEELKRLDEIGNYISVFTAEILQMEQHLLNDTLSLETLIFRTEKGDQKNPEKASVSLADSLGKIEESVASYPELMYDGPFSDRLLKQEPVLIKDHKTISENDAKKIAARALGVKAEEILKDDASDNRIPEYSFKRGTVRISVTKQGGFIREIIDSRGVAKSKISVKEAVKKAGEYLTKLGYKNMEENYYVVNENVLTVNFAYVENSVTCYTDMIKVAVSLEDGRITGLEATGFVMSHHNRTFAVSITEANARTKVSPLLAIKSSRLALIPTDGKYERLCYEFKTTSDTGATILVYINAVTGAEEKILMLVESDKGYLTI